jgi:DNA polymerase-3 subunit epsilon
MNQTFKDVVARRNFVVLDTETTGLDKPAEICQIGIIDCDGNTLLDTLVKPKRPIPSAAIAIHGISNEAVQDSLTWPDVREWVLRYIRGKDVIVYNATYDRKLMHWSDEAWECPHVDYKEQSAWYCAMEAYAEHYGEINEYYGTYRWQRLISAITQQGLPVSDAHSALGDCLMTLQLINHCCK